MFAGQAFDHIEVFVEIERHELTELLIDFTSLHLLEEVLIRLTIARYPAGEYILRLLEFIGQPFGLFVKPHLLALLLASLDSDQVPLPNLAIVSLNTTLNTIIIALTLFLAVLFLPSHVIEFIAFDSDHVLLMMTLLAAEADWILILVCVHRLVLAIYVTTLIP